jgi:HK97 family phage portal protein
MVYPEYGRDGSLWYRVSGELNGRMVTEMVPAYDMIHIKGFTTNAITGKRISLVHSSTIGAGLAAQRYSENVYGRGAHSSFAVKYDQALEEKEATDIEDRIWNRIGGMDKTGRPFVLDDGMDIERLQWSPDEVLLIDFSRLSAEHASMITQVPMEMLRSESTGTYGAALMRSQNFLTHGLQPYIEKIQEEFNRKLFWVKEYNQRKVFFRFDTSMYVRMDKETEMNVLTGFVAGGVLTPNEARTRLGLVGLPGGDALYIPSTMVPAVNLITQQQSIGEPSGDAAAAVSGGEPQTDNKKLPKPSAVAKNQDIEDEAESGIVSAE